MKNPFFKKSAGIVCDFKTLAHRHQYNAFHLPVRLPKQYLRKSAIQHSCGPAPACNYICSAFGIMSMQRVNVAAKIKIASAK